MSLQQINYTQIRGGIPNVKDFGAKGDGTTDDTSAIQSAINTIASTGGGVYFPVGNYLISSTINVTTPGISLFGDNGTAIWNGLTFVYTSGSVILKKSTMTTSAIKNAGGLKLCITNLGISGQVGNTGDGIYIEDGQSTILTNVSVAKMGGNGIRLGTTGANGNCNAWQLNSVTSQYNGGHGVYIYDQFTPTAPNVNAGTANGLNLQGNTGDGLRIENGIKNTFNGFFSQSNTGYGVTLLGTSVTGGMYTNFFISDIEANTAGNWNIDASVKHINIIGPSVSAPTTLDPSINFSSVITGGNALLRGVQFSLTETSLSSYIEATWTPTDASIAGLTFTTVSCTSVKVGKIIVCGGRITWPITADASPTKFTLPYTGGLGSFSISSTYGSPIVGYVAGNYAYIQSAGEVAITNANMSGKEININISYVAP